ncbi:hypothetical protein T492DRAFT_40320 [Pavlovales sp. CCMP2436]|nr:hypothetical protein T492DRAFT_40320 [Pavlovales sp. CCMP2436]|mmetsp:Transcript_7537/g.17928  ORF Transcript_7537/g.17928 Transcript_7537/m.17928 type:complete len:212 (-) Transcript_7537:206-841(-)
MCAQAVLDEQITELEISCVHAGCRRRMTVAEVWAHVRVCPCASANSEPCGWSFCDQHAARRCARCWAVRYCSQEHQLLDRPAHRLSCRERSPPPDGPSVRAAGFVDGIRADARRAFQWAIAASSGALRSVRKPVAAPASRASSGSAAGQGRCVLGREGLAQVRGACSRAGCAEATGAACCSALCYSLSFCSVAKGGKGRQRRHPLKNRLRP